MVATRQVNSGELALATPPGLLKTLLGSCVAVVIWHPDSKWSGMCHYLLPSPPDGRMGGEPGRYGRTAIPLLYKRLQERSGRQRGWQAKAFGGGVCLGKDGGNDVGRGNARQAVSVLAELELPVVASDFGGPYGRDLRFDPATGECLVRRYRPALVAAT